MHSWKIIHQYPHIHISIIHISYIHCWTCTLVGDFSQYCKPFTLLVGDIYISILSFLACHQYRNGWKLMRYESDINRKMHGISNPSFWHGVASQHYSPVILFTIITIHSLLYSIIPLIFRDPIRYPMKHPILSPWSNHEKP